MVRALKPGTTVHEQIELMRQRGMDVNEDEARQWLSNVGYYRLSAYSYPARMIVNGRRLDTYSPGTRFSDVTALYEADRKLRTLIHDGIERIEVGLRVHICQQLCIPDPLRYQDKEVFRPSFPHDEWRKRLNQRIHRSESSNTAIKHYAQYYESQFPLWVLSEVLDFRDISMMFQGLRRSDQRVIDERLGLIVDLNDLPLPTRRSFLKESPSARWYEQLTVVRNTEAHHARCWNRSYTTAPTETLRRISGLEDLPAQESKKVFGALVFMTYLLKTYSPGSAWAEKVAALINDEFLPNPLVTRQAPGLPRDWQSFK
ncbi:Abi family protein [Arcanobacterium haemolyticum]|nr:Abi family protein [Arcanobacterium haemolyticum]